jgi:predicted phage terminase large subunit-like protein
VNGPITGQGAHLLVIDDPVKNNEQAASATYRDNLWDWYQATAYPRLEERAAIVVIMTRWHEDDLAGRLLAEAREGGDQWRVLHLPARDAARAPLWPEKFDDAALARIERAIGPLAWAALYMGDPQAEGVAILQRAWWKRYLALPALVELVVSWDCSFADEADSSYVVGQVWGRVGADAYLVDQVRERADFVRTIALMRAVRAAYPRAGRWLIENKANGPAALATLRREIPGMLAVNPRGGKVARAIAVSGFVQAGNVHLPAAAPWVGGFVEEATRFPRGVNDDQVDCATQALLHLYAPERASLPLPQGAVTLYG